MSTVSDQVKCPQCGCEEANYEFNCRTSEKETLCPQCGYIESREAKRDEDGQFHGWKHDITHGVGALWYRPTDGIAFACHSLHTADEFAKAERWLKEQLAAGTVDKDTARLNRWNKESRRVELIVGTLDHTRKMEQIVAELGLNPVTCTPGKAARIAILPSKVAVVSDSSCVIVPVLHYLNADPASGKYTKGADGTMPPIEYELGYLALSRSELGEISNLQEPALPLCGIDIVMSVSHPEFGRAFRREFGRVCNKARWTLDPAIAKQVEDRTPQASSELAAKCASHSDAEVFADLRTYLTHKNGLATGKFPDGATDPDGRAIGPVTDDKPTNSSAIFKCLTCGIVLGGRTKYVWQGKNRWCEKCFWGEDSESDIANVPAMSDSTEKGEKDTER